MIAHQTKGMNTMTVALHPFLHKQIKSVAIFLTEKHISPAIATKHDMIISTRNVNPRFTSHAAY